MEMLKAENIGGNKWRVTETEVIDGEEVVLWSHKVATKAGGTAKDAKALAEEVRNPTPPSEEEVAAERAKAAKEAAVATVDQHVERTAKSRDYNDAAALAGYVSSTVPDWAAEAQAFVAWRDAVWQAVFGILADVEAGEREAPTPDDLITELPAIDWP